MPIPDPLLHLVAVPAAGRHRQGGFGCLGIWLGVRLTLAVNERPLHRLSHAFLLLTGSKLAFDGLRGLGRL